MGRRDVAGNCQELLRWPAARPQPIAAPARAAFFVPAGRARLTLQSNEAGLRSYPEPRRPPLDLPSAVGRPFLPPHSARSGALWRLDGRRQRRSLLPLLVIPRLPLPYYVSQVLRNEDQGARWLPHQAAGQIGIALNNMDRRSWHLRSPDKCADGHAVAARRYRQTP
jgi:hypothetical protein